MALAMKAMKAMKASKAMKAMKVMKAKKVGKKWQVLTGSRVTTSGGLRKEDLMRNKHGKVVSKKMHAAGKRLFARVKNWNLAVSKAKEALRFKGFVAIGGRKPEGKALYAKAKAIMASM